MKKEKPVVLWNIRASIYFRKAYEYIKDESYTNAEKVRNGIVKVIDNLPTNPGKYRAFEKYSYRIAYKHTDNEVRIIRMRHVKQEPKEYWIICAKKMQLI